MGGGGGLGCQMGGGRWQNNLNFVRGYPKNMGAGAGRKNWARVGGLNPMRRGARPPVFPHVCSTCQFGNMSRLQLV